MLGKRKAETLLKANHKKAEDLLAQPDALSSFLHQVEQKLTKLPLVGKDLATLPAFIGLLRSYLKDGYREVPYGSLIAMLATLIYVVNPLDLVPDVLPIVGQLDDLALIKACASLVRMDLVHYRQWQANRSKQ